MAAADSSTTLLCRTVLPVQTLTDGDQSSPAVYLTKPLNPQHWCKDNPKECCLVFPFGLSELRHL